MAGPRTLYDKIWDDHVVDVQFHNHHAAHSQVTRTPPGETR